MNQGFGIGCGLLALVFAAIGWSIARGTRLRSERGEAASAWLFIAPSLAHLLVFSIGRLKRGGWLVIEDIHEHARPVWQLVSALLPAEVSATAPSPDFRMCRARGRPSTSGSTTAVRPLLPRRLLQLLASA